VKPTKLTAPISIVRTGSTRIRVFHTDIGDFTGPELKQLGIDPIRTAVRVRDKGWQYKHIFHEGHLPRKVPPKKIEVSRDVKTLGERPRLRNLEKIKVGSFEAWL
jgi:hypothetical protein